MATHRNGRRMGPQTRLRRRLHRQGDRYRGGRLAEQHREPDPWRARRRHFRRAITGSERHQSPGSQRVAFNAATPKSLCIQARALATIIRKKPGARTCSGSIKFAFSVLNQEARAARRTISPSETPSRSPRASRTAGELSVRAVEQDDDHIIDGLAVGEPNVNPKFSSELYDTCRAERPAARRA